jgi:small subunit ribosomal protein S4
VGDPRKSKKKYTRPRSIWTSDQISSELYIVGSYGLRNKRELWRAQTEIARIRNQARSLLSLPIEVRHEKETNLLNYLIRLGVVESGSTLDDILNLKIEDILERRLQTIVMKRSNLKSPYQARQIVVHGHVSIGNRKINLPGYLVRKDEELEILLHLSPAAESTAINANTSKGTK